MIALPLAFGLVAGVIALAIALSYNSTLKEVLFFLIVSAFCLFISVKSINTPRPYGPTMVDTLTVEEEDGIQFIKYKEGSTFKVLNINSYFGKKFKDNDKIYKHTRTSKSYWAYGIYWQSKTETKFLEKL